MASGAFAAALVAFHLVLFLALYLFARGRHAPARAALAVAMAPLAYVVYDLARDPDPHRLGGLSMGLTFMFGTLWVAAGSLFLRFAHGVDRLEGGMAWLARRSRHWAVGGCLGTLAFGAAFPRLRGAGGGLEAPWGAGALALGGALAVAAALVVLLRVRPDASVLSDPSVTPEARATAARRAALGTWASLAVGVVALALLGVAGP